MAAIVLSAESVLGKVWYFFSWGGEPLLRVHYEPGLFVFSRRDSTAENGWQDITCLLWNGIFSLASLQKALAMVLTIGEETSQDVAEEILAMPTFFRRQLLRHPETVKLSLQWEVRDA